MLSSIQGLFGKKNNTAPATESEVSVRSPDDIQGLEKMIKVGPVTLVLVHADWCGPCQGYKPVWNELEQSPGRKANMAMVHHDMVENSPTLKNAKIPGYPSVLKVYSNGHIEEYKGPENKKTNAMPNIRDKPAMMNELKNVKGDNILNLNSAVKNRIPGSQPPLRQIPQLQQQQPELGKRVSLFNKQPIQVTRNNRNMKRSNNTLTYKSLNKQYPASELTRRNLTNAALRIANQTKPSSNTVQSIGATVPPMKGGLYNALSAALMRAGPASILFAASQMLPTKKVRGSTMRRTRKSNSRSRKN